MNLVFILTALGPLAGGTGLLFSIGWLFWVGVGFAALNLFLNLASGTMKLPVLPALFMFLAGILLSPWYRGAAIGLLVWTTLESLGEIWAIIRGSHRAA